MAKQSSQALPEPSSDKCDKCEGLLVDAASNEGSTKRCLNCGTVVFAKSGYSDAVVGTQLREESHRQSGGVAEGNIRRSSLELPIGKRSKIQGRHSQSKRARSASLQKGERRPLTLFDHIQAVRRHPQFLNEAQALQRQLHGLLPVARKQQLVSLLVRNEVADKWNVPPEVVLGAGAIPLNRLRKCDDGRIRVVDLLPEETFEPRNGYRGCAAVASEESLIISMDWTLPESEILAGIQRILPLYQHLPNLRSPKGKRKKPTALDPWLIYDLRHYDGAPLVTVARNLFGLTGNPAYDLKLKRRLGQVERACAKAEAMIRAVQPNPKP